MVAHSWAVLIQTAALVMFSSIFLTANTSLDLNFMVEFVSITVKLQETLSFDKTDIPPATLQKLLPEAVSRLPNTTVEYTHTPTLIIPRGRGQTVTARVFCMISGCSEFLARYETGWSGDLSSKIINDLQKSRFFESTTLEYMRNELDASFYSGGQDAYDLAMALKAQEVLFIQEQLDAAQAASEAARAAYQSSQATLFFGLAATLATILLWISLVRFKDNWPRLVLAAIAVASSFVAGLVAIGIRDGAQEYLFQFWCEYPSNNAAGQTLSVYRNDRNIFFIKNPNATEYATPQVLCDTTADYRWGFWALWVGWAFAVFGAVAVYFAHLERSEGDDDDDDHVRVGKGQQTQQQGRLFQRA